MIAQPLALGELYPASSNMPYIVLDRADYLAFIGASATTKEIPLDAFRVNLTLSVGGEKTFTAQICGILEDEAADSAGGGMGDTGGTAYMGLDTARRILGESGQELRLNSLAVWVESYYAAADVIEQAAPLGLTEDGGMLALLDGWAAKEGEANFLMIAAALLLLCAFLLLRAKLTLLFAHKAPELTLLHELGLPQRRVGRVVRGAGLLAGLCAAVVTVLVCVALPFIVAEGLPESVFALHMPVEVLAEGFAVCVVAGVGCMVRLGID